MLLGENKFSGMLLVLLIMYAGSLRGSADVTASASLSESERSGSGRVTDVKEKEQNLNDSTVPNAVQQSSKVDIPVKEKAYSVAEEVTKVDVPVKEKTDSVVEEVAKVDIPVKEKADSVAGEVTKVDIPVKEKTDSVAGEVAKVDTPVKEKTDSVVEEVKSSPMQESSIQKGAATSAETVSSEPEKDSQGLKIVEDKEGSELEQSGARKEMPVKKRDALRGQSSVPSKSFCELVSLKLKNLKKVRDLNGHLCSYLRADSESKGSEKTAGGVSGESKNSDAASGNNSDTKEKSNSGNLNSKSDEGKLGNKNCTRPESEDLLGTSSSVAGISLSANSWLRNARGLPVSLSGYIQPSDSAVVNNSKSLLKEGEGDDVPKVSDKANCPETEVSDNKSRNKSTNDSRSLPNGLSESLQSSVNATNNPNCEATKCSDAGIVSKQKIPVPSDKIDCNPNVEQAENSEKKKVEKPKNLFSSSSFDLDLYLSSYFDVEGIIKRNKARRRKVRKSFEPELDRSVEKRTPEVEASENEDGKSKPGSCDQTSPCLIDYWVKVFFGALFVITILSMICAVYEHYRNKHAQRSGLSF